MNMALIIKGYAYLHDTHELCSYTVQFIFQMHEGATWMCFLTQFHVKFLLLSRTVHMFVVHFAVPKI
jgi:hypothetical protein